MPKNKKKTEKVDLVPSQPKLYGGGTAANVAVALARLGVPVAFVGAVGEVDLLAPCVPTKIVAVGRNYAEHAAELRPNL